MRRIACLHTADSNVAVFKAAFADLGWPQVELRHHVRADLLAAAEHAGGLTKDILTRTQSALREASHGADIVLLTCSTLGPAAFDDDTVPVMRVDAALADEAVRHGGTVTVLCAVRTTLDPTRALFEQAASATGATIDVRLVPDAWDAFTAGELALYHAIIARAADLAMECGAPRVVLAQASMAGAAKLVKFEPGPLTSPAAGLTAALGWLAR